MANPLQRYVEAATGLTSLTRARAEQIVKQLVKQGSDITDSAGDLVEDLLERSKRNRDSVVQLVRVETTKAIKALGLARLRDVERLQRQVSDLKARATGSRSSAKRSSNGSTSTRSSAKKSSSGASASSGAKKASAKKSAAKKSSSGGSSSGAKKASIKKSPAKKSSSGGSSGGSKKATAKKSTAKKSTAKKSTAKKSTAKKSTAKKSSGGTRKKSTSSGS